MRVIWFDNTILHGFASLSRTYEVLRQNAEEDIPIFLELMSVLRGLSFFFGQVLVQKVAKVQLVDQTGLVCMVGDYSFQNLQDPIRSALVLMTSGNSYSAKSRSLRHYSHFVKTVFLAYLGLTRNSVRASAIRNDPLIFRKDHIHFYEIERQCYRARNVTSKII